MLSVLLNKSSDSTDPYGIPYDNATGAEDVVPIPTYSVLPPVG
jgi:hypothetical protein